MFIDKVSGIIWRFCLSVVTIVSHAVSSTESAVTCQPGCVLYVSNSGITYCECPPVFTNARTLITTTCSPGCQYEIYSSVCICDNHPNDNSFAPSGLSGIVIGCMVLPLLIISCFVCCIRRRTRLQTRQTTLRQRALQNQTPRGIQSQAQTNRAGHNNYVVDSSSSTSSEKPTNYAQAPPSYDDVIRKSRPSPYQPPAFWSVINSKRDLSTLTSSPFKAVVEGESAESNSAFVGNPSFNKPMISPFGRCGQGEKDRALTVVLNLESLKARFERERPTSTHASEEDAVAKRLSMAYDQELQSVSVNHI